MGWDYNPQASAVVPQGGSMAQSRRAFRHPYGVAIPYGRGEARHESLDAVDRILGWRDGQRCGEFGGATAVSR